MISGGSLTSGASQSSSENLLACWPCIILGRSSSYAVACEFTLFAYDGLVHLTAAALADVGRPGDIHGVAKMAGRDFVPQANVHAYLNSVLYMLSLRLASASFLSCTALSTFSSPLFIRLPSPCHPRCHPGFPPVYGRRRCASAAERPRKSA